MVTYSFTYNDEGIRTSKTVNGVKHTYLLEGSRIISEQWGNHHIVYVYDETGAPVGMYYRTSSYAEGTFDVFYFEKNLQGDIIGVYNSSGTCLIGYTYDAWGNCTVQYYSNGSSSPARYNPFRYRGYYFDSDLGLYYLNSRYYDPNTGRFINADGYTSTGQGLIGNNMFIYCGNNPINRKDPTGQFWIAALIVTVVVVVCTGEFSGCSRKPDPTPLPYETADEAAMAFANSTYSSSSYIRHEYGTVIYSITINGITTYDFATPVAGTPHSVGYGNVKIPSGTTKVATAHTHPNSNSFSGLSPGATSGDIPNAIRRGIDSYVIGPNLKLQKYSISSKTVSIVGVASPIELTSQQQATLVLQFQMSWDNHLGTCAFGCEHMTWPTP